MRTLLLASALFAGLLGSLAAAPASDHAFCKTHWLFETPCAEISTKLVLQIEAFSPLNRCEQCQYLLVSFSPRSIKANHTSPDSLQGEGIIFTMTPTPTSSGCQVYAQSTFFGFSSRRDNGINYCNLYNLLSASGLDSAPGFKDMINQWACPSYKLATCKTPKSSE